MQEFIKASADVLDYQVDWSGWLSPIDDVIDTSTWVITPDNTMEVDSHTDDGEIATAWISGGNDQGNYTVTNTIVTTGGRTKTARIIIRVRDRLG